MARAGILSLLIAATGCGGASSDGRPEPRCGPDRPCDEGQGCIPSRIGVQVGTCVKSCTREDDCPEGSRCTGRHQETGTVDRYCRKAIVAPGAPCTGVARGCRPGARCFRETCVRECRKDGDCPDRDRRCLPVMVDTLLDRERETVFGACLPARRKEGETCSATGPFCTRGTVCREERCVRTCDRDDQCSKGRICDGALFEGPKAVQRARQRLEPDIRYCRRAASRGQSCHHNLDVGCARGLACIRFKCRRVRRVAIGKRCAVTRGIFCQEGGICFEGRCRRPCLTDEDCNPGSARKGEPDHRRPGRRGKSRREEGTTCQGRIQDHRAMRLCL